MDIEKKNEKLKQKEEEQQHILFIILTSCL